MIVEPYTVLMRAECAACSEELGRVSVPLNAIPSLSWLVVDHGCRCGTPAIRFSVALDNAAARVDPK